MTAQRMVTVPLSARLVAAAADPCTKRPATRAGKVGARPHAAEESTKTTSPEIMRSG
jgi:hypothetical protein